jgi:hypothetical protein
MSETNAAAEAVTETPEAQPQLQLGDIEAAVKVIDHAANEGAFKGWQVMQEVLMLRNRLVTFVQAAMPAKEEGADETSTAVADAPVTEAPAAPAAPASDIPEAPAG